MSNVFPLDLGQQNYRPPGPSQSQPAANVDVTVLGDSAGVVYDEATNTTQIPLPDGTISITQGPPARQKKTEGFDGNLAEELSEAELSTIAERILAGVELDIQSRAEWLENMSNGISLLGLAIKNPRGAAASGATPAEGVSTVDHPLLLEAVLRFQANARGELLPTDGPVKVRNDGEGNEMADRLAEALEKDMNHYLTKVAKEYYPDTDRMLLMLGFSGISFKKGYHDPIKRRPVIASIDAKDLIVSNAATDIDGAGRVTHRIMMRPSTLRRMQLVGVYRDIALPDASLPENKNPVDQAIDRLQGIAPPTYTEPSDQDRELYETYCELDIPGFEHEMDGDVTGLPLPYKVTIDKDARRVLEIRRNWDEDDPFCLARNRIIAYIFIPGLGFYGIGLLNILGNATKAVTAAWRLLIDAGMFSNFPGFLYLKSLAKQLTNQFRIPPGGGMPIDTVGNDIRASIMPLPYQPPSQVFMELIENIASTAQRVGGTAETQIGEGKQDAPVGTTLALIEQATKLMSAVHKRLHQAQGAEFDMLRDLLMEDPEALWRHNKKSKVLKLLTAASGQEGIVNAEDAADVRHREMFIAALNDLSLVPAADPNTSSQTERYLKAVAMRQMAQTNPNLDMNAVDRRALQTMGIDDADSLFKPPPAPGTQAPPPPDPASIAANAAVLSAQAKITDAQTKASTAALKAQQDQKQQAVDTSMEQQKLSTQENIAHLQVARELVIHDADQQQAEKESVRAAQQQQADREHEAGLAALQNSADARQAVADRTHEAGLAALGHQQEAKQSAVDRAHEAALTGLETKQGIADRTHEAIQNSLNRRHEATQSAQEREAQMLQQPKNGVAPE